MDSGTEMDEYTFETAEQDDNFYSDIKQVKDHGLNDGDVSFEPCWRANMERRLDQLTRRVSELELLQPQSSRPHWHSFQEASFTTLGDKWLGLATCIEVIRAKRTAALQCVWLILCATIFLYLCGTEFNRARNNELAAYKPLALESVKDYGSPGFDEYDVPDLYARVLVTNDHPLTEDQALSLMEQMFGPQGEKNFTWWFRKQFDIYCMYEGATEDWQWWNPNLYFGLARLDYNISWQVPGWKKETGKVSFIGLIRVQLEQPDPMLGAWTCGLYMDLDRVSLDWRVGVTDLQVFMDREVPEIQYDSFNNIWALQNGTATFFRYSYKESKINLLNWDQTYVVVDDFTVSDGGWFRESFGKKDRVLTLLVPDLRLETWSEYVEYGFEDWVFAMGGLLSWISIVFFWGAYYIVKCIDGNTWTMGITPIMSFTFNNIEEIFWMKYKLQKVDILPSEKYDGELPIRK